MRLRDGMLAVSAIILSAGVANAQPFQGFYVGAGVGYHATQDINASPSPAAALGTNGLNLRANGGFVGLASAGYGLGNGWRFELEGSDRLNNLGHLSGTPFPTSPTGSFQTYAVMANALFDLDVRSPWVYPYLGGGVGYAWTAMSNLGTHSANPLYGFNSNATQGGFAYQAIAGLSFPIPNTPGLSLSAEYRLFGQPNSRNFSGSAAVPGGSVPASLRLRGTIDNAGLIGIRYAFNVLPPAMPAAAEATPAPAPVRSFLVFFDWDRTALTDRARQIVRDAAESSRKTAVTRIEVNGYTDTSGAAAYNQGLSLRRAQVVAAELVKNGVAKEAIAIHGYGDTRLLTPTGAGVREPQNRRVEIILR